MTDFARIEENIQSILLSADDLLTREWPEPVWPVPGILPVGLSVLAGPPKVGKSWLALQFAQAVATGGMALDARVEQGSVLYLALEEPPRRLQDRMKKQSWQVGLQADFITIGDFRTSIGDLSKSGSQKLAHYLGVKKYRFVIIDTFSRAFSGDQDDVGLMTSALTPIQEMSHANNSAELLIDHHRKHTNEGQDPIADILGSTAKGAMADTVMGLYQERGKPGARLIITGREVEYRSLDLIMDWMTGVWQLNKSKDSLPPEQKKTFGALEQVGEASPQELADKLNRNRGAVYKDLVELEKKGHVLKIDDNKWKVSRS